MPFEWKDNPSSDGPPEKTRRRVQAHVEAHFANRLAKPRKPGTAMRALDRAIRSLPAGIENIGALSVQQRFRLEDLHAKALREHEEFFRKSKLARTTHAGRTKKHSGLVLVPRCLSAPYATSVSFTTTTFADGFVERDTAIMRQPNGESILADDANGVAGETMFWEFKRGDTGALEVTRGVLIGGWIQAGNTKPLFLDAQLTAVPFTPQNWGNGGGMEGWIYIFGGGFATYQVFTELFVFTDVSQTTRNPPTPVMSARVPVVDASVAPIQKFEFSVPGGTSKNVSGVASSVSPGTWMLVMAGPVTRLFASVWHADWGIGGGATWTIDKICGYW